MHNEFKPDFMTGANLSPKNQNGSELKDPIVRATWNGGGNEAAPTYPKYVTTNTNSDPNGILKNYIWPQSTGTTYQFSNFCQYRLPCGYCERLMRDCPKWRLDNTPHLNKVDCATNTESVPQSGSLTTAQNACGGWKDEE